MSLSDRPPGGDPPGRLNASRVLTWWFAVMSLAGLLFGWFAAQEPAGAERLAVPLVLFAIVVGAALVALGITTRRPPYALMSVRHWIVIGAVGVAALAIGGMVRHASRRAALITSAKFQRG